jgi:hypothetical protein
MKPKEFLILHLKDTLIFAAWISGLLLIGGLSWFLTRPIRTNFLQESINRVLIRIGDYRRVEAPLNPSRRTLGSSPMGQWFRLKDRKGSLLFFICIADGTLLPCAAILNGEGKVEEIIPLSSRGERTFSYVSPGIIKLYIKRIEGES